MAAGTPVERNRYVDFLRAFSILFVISGHWLITGGHIDAQGDYAPVLALEVVPWTVWLTWIFQVMPVFFMVGGYANAVSLESARARGIGYAEWLAARMHRLLRPMLLLVLVWAVISVLLYAMGASSESIQFISRTAAIADLVSCHLHNDCRVGSAQSYRLAPLGLLVLAGLSGAGRGNRCRFLRVSVGGARLEQLFLGMAGHAPSWFCLARPAAGRATGAADHRHGSAIRVGGSGNLGPLSHSHGRIARRGSE